MGFAIAPPIHRSDQLAGLQIKMEKNLLSYTYIDNSNVFIEAQRVSAIEIGMAADLQDAFDRRIFNFSYKLDYGKLYLITYKLQLTYNGLVAAKPAFSQAALKAMTIFQKKQSNLCLAIKFFCDHP